MSYEVVRSILAGNPAISVRCADRIFNKVAPQKAKLPRAVVNLISYPRDGFTMSGAHADIETPTYQVSFFSTDADECELLARAAVDAFEETERADVAGAFPEALSDGYDAAPDGDEEHTHISRVEVRLCLVTS